ncbi:MAG: ABC transporter permease/substrate-binding protein [Pirellulales bacterium]
MSESFRQQLEVLPGNLANHLLITILPLLLGLSISLPLAVLAVRRRSLRYPTLTAVSIIQTIPSLALLALMVPVLIALGGFTSRVMGFEISALGFYPTVIALTLYSMLPMVRNAVTGILDVDPALTEAARGMGMTSWQVLWKVELPLALPVIVAGIRTATVWTVGIATLATPVGQRCLGNYIFQGLQTRNWTAVLFGCVAAAVLAIGLDLLIGALQRAADERRPRLAMGAGATLAVVVVAGLVAPQALQWYRSIQPRDQIAGRQRAAAPEQEAADRRPIVVGAKTFTEQYILAELIANRLQDAGVEVSKTESLGSTVVFDGLVSGEIDCYVDYTGTIWANYMDREGSAAGWKVLAEVAGWLAGEHDVRSLGSLGFENAYALAMRRERADQLDIRTIGDLAEHDGEMMIGSDYEFFGRPEWDSLRRAYGLQFADRTSYDSTFMYDAIANGEVDVISAFSSDGRIKAYDLVLLEDPAQAIPPYDAVLLLSPSAAGREDVVEALRPLIGEIRQQAMQNANYLVDRDENRQTVDEAAAWLSQTIDTADADPAQAATQDAEEPDVQEAEAGAAGG